MMSQCAISHPHQQRSQTVGEVLTYHYLQISNTLLQQDGKSLGAHTIKVDRTFDAATYQQIVDHGMMVPIDMDIPAGGKELRLAVLDNKTGFIGTVSGPLGQ
jgi:hypothetical protein